MRTAPDLSSIGLYFDEGKDQVPVGVDQPEISMMLDGRRYGDSTPMGDLFEQPLPPVLKSVVDEIWGRSAILNLKEAGLTKDQIYVAYQQDLNLLRGYLGDFEAMIQAAVRHSIICSEGGQLAAEEEWEVLQSGLPILGKDPLLRLSSERAAKPAITLLWELVDEFKKGVVRVMVRMAFWLQMLVHDEFVGLLTQNAEDICNYHYFRRESEEREVGQRSHTIHGENGSTTPGEMMTARQTTWTTVQKRVFCERHTHHVVNVKRYNIEDFTERVPRRVARFLESVPAWLIPHLQIVTGEMTMAEVRRKTISDETAVIETVATWTYDPALVLGRHVLMGWTGDEMAGHDSGAVYSGRQKIAAFESRRETTIFGGVALAVMLAVALAVIGGYRLYAKSAAETQAAYATYLETLPEEGMKFTTLKAETLALPGEQDLRYAGASRSARPENVLFVLGDTIRPSARISQSAYWFELKGYHPEERGAVYGEIDLAPAGIFVRLKVLKASEEEITYLAIPYQK